MYIYVYICICIYKYTFTLTRIVAIWAQAGKQFQSNEDQ